MIKTFKLFKRKLKRKLSRIREKFRQLKRANRAAFIPFLTAGYPNLQSFLDLIRVLASNGADIIEIGLPFSDPLADGPTIQRSSQIALAQGVNLPLVFEMVKQLREEIDLPFVLMSYYNPLYKMGITKFFSEASKAGFDGVIVPDLPIEEANSWVKKAANKIDPIFLVAPTSTLLRIKKITSFSKGFVYCVSLTGITGEREKLPLGLRKFILQVKSVTEKPVAVGFGISNPFQVREVAQIADGVIIGSAIINLIDSEKSRKEQIKILTLWIKEITSSLVRE